MKFQRLELLILITLALLTGFFGSNFWQANFSSLRRQKASNALAEPLQIKVTGSSDLDNPEILDILEHKQKRFLGLTFVESSRNLSIEQLCQQ